MTTIGGEGPGMPRRAGMNWKGWFRKLHLWLALAASLPLLVLAVTGALLVFPEPARRLATGVDLRIETGVAYLPPSRLIASIAGALPPGARIARLVYPTAPGEALRVDADRHVAAVDPYSGRVLRVVDARLDFVRVVTDLHVSLMAGEAGTWVTGLASVALLALCVTGLRLWWPVGRWRLAYFTVSLGRGGKRANFDLHRAVGFYGSLFLFPIALTGAAMAFWEVAAPAAYWLTWSEPAPEAPRSVRPPGGVAPVSPDRALALALAAHPGLEPRRLYLPADETRPYRVFLDPPGEHELRTREVRLEIDPYTGRILHEEGPRTMSRGDRLLRWVLPLHFGTFGGTPTKWLYLAASLSPVLLAATGLILWRNRLRKRRPGPRTAGGRARGLSAASAR